MISLGEWIELLESGKAAVTTQIIVTCCVVAVALLVMFVYENWLRNLIKRLISRSRNTWDDYIFSDKLMRVLGYYLPFIVIYETLPYCLVHGTFLYTVCSRALLSVIIALVSFSLCIVIEGVNNKIQASDSSNRPTSGIFQMIKLVIWGITVILIIATLIDRSPRVLLTGLTASAALLMLVFKDTIMGLVAGVQLAAYDMIHVGDWIIMEKHGINGEVEEVTLNIVKVRNWDNSVATVPPYVLMTDTFQNYLKMRAEKGRRITLELPIDFSSVCLCSAAQEQALKDKGLYAAPEEIEMDVPETRKVNLTLFSRYVEKYLESLPFVNTEMRYMVRVKKPTPTGLPVEIYCHVKNVEWKHFEHTQSRVLEHIIAVLPEFGLRVFQTPSGIDLTSLKH